MNFIDSAPNAIGAIIIITIGYIVIRGFIELCTDKKTKIKRIHNAREKQYEKSESSTVREETSKTNKGD